MSDSPGFGSSGAESSGAGSSGAGSSPTRNSSRRKPIAIAIVIVSVVFLASIIGWLRLHVDSSLEPLLPENSEARQTVLFLRDSSFASKVILWFRLKPGVDDSALLFSAADDTEKHLDPSLINRVVHAPKEADAFGEAVQMLDYAGELLDEHDLSEVEAATHPDAIKKRMREIYLQLTQLQGSFFQPILRKDPLGVSDRILARLYALTKGVGYKVDVKNGRLVNPDGRQLLMVMESSATATNLSGSLALINHLDQISSQAPPGVEIIPMCSQLHSVQNQQMMEGDIHLAGIVNGIVFLLLFILVSRDFRVAAVFLLPLFSIGLTIGLCALVHPSWSMMVIGISITMAGSAVDYGIFVYTAVTMGNDRQADMRRIRTPLLVSHLTTLGVFLAFTFSKVPAYRQLGWMTSVSLVLSLLAALFLLPGILRAGGKILLLGSGMPLSRWGRIMLPALGAGLILLVSAAILSRKTNFDPDLTRLDAVSPTVRMHEDEFTKNWSTSQTDMGLLMVSGHSLEQAEQANDEVFQSTAGKITDGTFATVSSVWPSEKTRGENLARWTAFWSPERIASLRRDLAVAGEPYGFSEDAFEPFFLNLAHPPTLDQTPEILPTILDQFTARAGDNYQVLSYFADTGENVAALRALAESHPQMQVISKRALGQAFADAALSETRLLICLSAGFIIVFLLAMTRSLSRSLIIILPVFAGLIGMLATLVVLHLSMNVVSVVAAILILALTSDYGIFALYGYENKEPLFGQGMASTHLCALTTLGGTAAMIFAKHPAIYLVGVSLTSGLLAGYFTAFLMIPAICYLRDRRKKLPGGTAPVAAAALLIVTSFLGGCAPEPFPPPQLPKLVSPDSVSIVEQFRRETPRQFSSNDTVIIQAPFHDDMVILGVLEVDRDAGKFELFGLSLSGIKLFHLKGDAKNVSIDSALPPLMQKKDILLAMGRDIYRMYFDLIPSGHEKLILWDRNVIRYYKPGEEDVICEFGSSPTVLLSKYLDGFFGYVWRVRYFDYQPQGGFLYPHGIVMDNSQLHYRIIVKNRDWSGPQ